MISKIFATEFTFLGEFTPRIKDKITAYGEFLSSNIIAAKLKSDGLDCVWLDSRNYIKTNSNFTDAKVNFETTNAALQTYFKENKQQITLAPGFIASDVDGNITTLGRGGSDFTASIIAAAMKAQELQIWTDVSGMMTADPRLVSNAKLFIKFLTKSDGIVAFWCESDLSANNSACYGYKILICGLKILLQPMILNFNFSYKN